MPEITEADRAAAASYLSPARERTVDSLIQAFSAHREATEAAIVAWLRTPPVGFGAYECAEIADAIASGAHRG